MITGRARVAGVVGWPVEQSLSPVLHNAWIDALGLDAAYVPFAVRPEAFERWVEAMQAGGGVRGVNVTMPFKARAAKASHRLSTEAYLSGGANLLVFEADGPYGHSTDGLGLLAAFAEQAPDWRVEAAPVAVFGAGGAAGAAVQALVCDGGAPEVRVVVRDPARAQALLDDFGDRVRVFAFDDAAGAVRGARALVNGTPLGFRGAGELPVPWVAVEPGAVVMDMVMAPLDTPLLRAARARGHRTVDGLAMLIGQARPSFEALFGVAPPPDLDVRALALRAIAERGG